MKNRFSIAPLVFLLLCGGLLHIYSFAKAGATDGVHGNYTSGDGGGFDAAGYSFPNSGTLEKKNGRILALQDGGFVTTDGGGGGFATAGDIGIPMRKAIPAAEYAALVDLYNETGGLGWGVQAGWLDDDADYPFWAGVSVDGLEWDWDGSEDVPTVLAVGHVTSIVLPGNHLTGGIPESVRNLPYLQHLELQNNDLIGTIPASLGELKDLVDLDLSDNKLTGGIPAALGNLTKLHALLCARNHLTGSIPVNLINLTTLHYLDVTENSLYDDDETQFSTLKALLDRNVEVDFWPQATSLSLGVEFDDDEMAQGAMPGDRKTVKITISNEWDDAAFTDPFSVQIYLTAQNEFFEDVDVLLAEVPSVGVIPARDSQTLTATIVLKPGGPWPLDRFGYRRFKVVRKGYSENAESWEFMLGEVINVITHGFNPQAPLFWDEFRAPWRELKTELEPDPSSPLYGHVRTIVPEWASSEGFTTAFASLFAAKFAEAHALNAIRNGDSLLALPYVGASEALKELAKRHAAESGAIARETASAVLAQIQTELNRGYPKFLVINLFGHSRGAAVNAGIARGLMLSGHPTDYYTALDGFSTDWPDDGGLIGDISISDEAQSAREKLNVRVQTPLSAWVVDNLESSSVQTLLLGATELLRGTDAGLLLKALNPDAGVREILRSFDLRAPVRPGFRDQLVDADHLGITEKFLQSDYVSAFYSNLLARIPFEDTLSAQSIQESSTSQVGFNDGSFEAAGKMFLTAKNLPALPEPNAFLEDWLWAAKDSVQALAGWNIAGDVRLEADENGSQARVQTAGTASIAQVIEVSEANSTVTFDLKVLEGADAGEAQVFCDREQLASFALNEMSSSKVKISLGQFSGFREFKLVIVSKTGASVTVDVDDFALESSTPPILFIEQVGPGELSVRLSGPSPTAAILQASSDLRNWTDLQPLNSTEPSPISIGSATPQIRFFRVKF